MSITVVTVAKELNPGFLNTLRSVNSQAIKSTIKHLVTLPHSKQDSAGSNVNFIATNTNVERRVCFLEDRGLYHGLNLALDLVDSDWFLFLHAGDYFTSSDSLQIIIDSLRRVGQHEMIGVFNVRRNVTEDIYYAKDLVGQF